MNEEELLEQTTPDDTTEKTAPENTPETEILPEEPKYKVKYNGEELELGVSDLITHAQKGMNYDHVHHDLEKTRQTSAEANTQLQRLTSVLYQYGYDGNPQEIADLLEAQHREIDPMQVRREREAAEAWETVQGQAELARREAETMLREAVFARDLAEIQRVNPNIKTLGDLGELFFKLRSAGIDNLEAYDLASKPKARPAPAGKDHLITTGGGTSSGGLVEIPREEIAMWKESFPNDAPAKLKERYNRAKKRQGG